MASLLYQTIEQISREKHIEPEVIVAAIEDAMIVAARKYLQNRGRSPRKVQSGLRAGRRVRRASSGRGSNRPEEGIHAGGGEEDSTRMRK